MIRVFLFFILFSQSLFGYNYDDLLLKAQSSIFPKIMLLDKKIKNKLVKSKVIYTIVYDENDYQTALHVKEYINTTFKGYFDTSKQFIYDNQIVKGNAGYYVLTPFVLKAKTAILVNRGFVPWHGKRGELVNIKIDDQPTTIEVGLIKPKQRIELKQQALSTTFPILIQSLDLNQLSQLSNYQIIPMLAQLDRDADNGFFRKWKPFYGSVDKHLGYALQWFLMALVLSIIAIRLLIKNSRN